MPGYSAKPLSLSLSHCCRFCLSSSSFSSTSIFLSLHWRSSYLSWELGTFTPTGDHWWGCEGVRVWGCDCEDQCRDVWGRVPHKHYMCTYMCLHSSVTMVTVIHSPPQGFVIMVTMLRELYDDIKRHLRDREVNSQRYYKLTPQGSLCTRRILAHVLEWTSSVVAMVGQFHTFSLSAGTVAVTSSNIQVSDILLIEKVSWAPCQPDSWLSYETHTYLTVL